MRAECRAPAPTAAGLPLGEATRVRVAVAAAQPIVRLGAVGMLERDPRMVVLGEAGDGLEALELARRLRPDVLLLEVRLPGLDGAVLLERLRRELPEVKALTFSAGHGPENAREALTAGAAGHLATRATREQLCEAVVATHRGNAVIEPGSVAQPVREPCAPDAADSQPRRSRLSAAEREILRLVAGGLTDRQIALEL